MPSQSFLHLPPSIHPHVLRALHTLQALSIDESTNPSAHQAARHLGTCHGLTNALRTSIPLLSNTGKIIIPQDLCYKYDVKSPRYLLSAFSQGDTKCREALQHAVRDIVERARTCLEKARELRESILDDEPNGKKAIAVLLPGVASETFLNRLESHDYNLTSLDLRNVGPMEHATCAFRMINARYSYQY